MQISASPEPVPIVWELLKNTQTNLTIDSSHLSDNSEIFNLTDNISFDVFAIYVSNFRLSGSNGSQADLRFTISFADQDNIDYVIGELAAVVISNFENDFVSNPLIGNYTLSAKLIRSSILYEELNATTDYFDTISYAVPCGVWSYENSDNAGQIDVNVDEYQSDTVIISRLNSANYLGSGYSAQVRADVKIFGGKYQF